MKGADGPVLHHLCWADDLYAMAGSIEHLIRILTDMTNAVEELHMKWKEKSLKIVAGPCTNYKSGRGGWDGGARYMARQSLRFCSKFVAPDLEGKLYVLCEEDAVL